MSERVKLEPLPFKSGILGSTTAKSKGVLERLSTGQKLTLGILLMLAYTTRRAVPHPELEFVTFVNLALQGKEALRQALLDEVAYFLEATEPSRLHGVLVTLAKESETEDGQIDLNWELEL